MIPYAASLFARVEDVNFGCGATHIIVGDGNVHDDDLDFCAEQDGLIPDEILLIDTLRKMSVRDRLIAYYTNANDSDPEAMADQDLADDEDDMRDSMPYPPEFKPVADGDTYAMRSELDTVKRQLIETQQTIIKLVDAIKKQQQQINDLAKWAADNSDDVSPGGILRS